LAPDFDRDDPHSGPDDVARQSQTLFLRRLSHRDLASGAGGCFHDESWDVVLDFPHPLYTVADAVVAMANDLVDAGILAQSQECGYRSWPS
jgi:hypothetical protein